MLNYRNVIILFFLLAVLFFVLDFYFFITSWIYIGIILAATVTMVYGSAKIQSGFYVKALNKADTKDKVVAFTFDDGPDEKITTQILDILKNDGIQAAFFCIGSKIQPDSRLLKRIESENHIIGTHSFSHHRYFDLYSSKRMLEEFTQTEEKIKNSTGRIPKLFRPPYGVTNPNVANAIRKKGYTVIGWSLKSRDTVISHKYELLNRLKKKVRPGDILLFHDTRKITVEVLPEFIHYLKKEDYSIIRLDKLLEIDAYV